MGSWMVGVTRAWDIVGLLRGTGVGFLVGGGADVVCVVGVRAPLGPITLVTVIGWSRVTLGTGKILGGKDSLGLGGLGGRVDNASSSAVPWPAHHATVRRPRCATRATSASLNGSCLPRQLS